MAKWLPGNGRFQAAPFGAFMTIMGARQHDGLSAGNGGGFDGWRQHFNLLRKMECRDEAASSDLLHGQPASRDMGSLAARGVDEFDRTKV
ncbi:hypothetical protein BES08_20445 (plasmid) [Novosphingobium resinovorum]|uniref:Uncharacterized protein n=1 Tax=Novosphingobium resinovorum TaxID=158500 RepID=A0A1D8AAV2_9SPHN|nr:hypothetical protein BES08_20445 [Novosphingobium resinovorum]